MNLVSYLARGQQVGPESLLHAQRRGAPTKQGLGRAAQALMLSFLLESGGACQRPMVRGEEIQDVALWDVPAEVPLHLGESASEALRLLQDAFTLDTSLSIPPPNLQSGEPFLYHALYLRVQDDPDLRRVASSLRRASPLTRLCRCPIVEANPLLSLADNLQGHPALTQEESEGLMAHPVMTFLLGYLADQWSSFDAPVSTVDGGIQLERLNARHATLRQALASCERLGKMSLISVFPLFFQRLFQRHFVDMASAVMQLSQWRLAERESLLRGYIALLGLGDALEECFQREIVQPGAYDWRHPLETRIFVRKYGRLWSTGGLHLQVTEAQRQLRGLMG